MSGGGQGGQVGQVGQVGETKGLIGRGLGFSYGSKKVFGGVDFAARPGEVVCLIGPNGEGKTTLVRVLSGLERAGQGTVELDGVALTALASRERARRVGVLLEAPDTTFGFTVRELVVMGRYPHVGRRTFESDGDRAATRRAMELLDLEALAESPVFALSAGQRQRVGMARLVCQDPQVFLFDEPTSNLDPAHAERFVALCKDLAKQGKACVCVVHDLDLAARLGDRVAILAGGLIAAEGAPDEVLTPAVILRFWGVETQRVDALTGRPSLIVTATR